MEKKDYLIVAAVAIIAITICVFSFREPNKVLLGDTYKDIYSVLDYNINMIETNMNEITINNGWEKLKELKGEDKKLKETYNLLVLDIKKCYLLTNDLENETYDNLKLMNYKDKEYVNKYELLKLNKKERCLNDFDKYNSMVLSDNAELSEKKKTQIGLIINYKEEPYKYKTFYELLYEESVTMSKIASLTNWLKIEYNTYKQ